MPSLLLQIKNQYWKLSRYILLHFYCIDFQTERMISSSISPSGRQFFALSGSSFNGWPLTLHLAFRPFEHLSHASALQGETPMNQITLIARNLGTKFICIQTLASLILTEIYRCRGELQFAPTIAAAVKNPKIREIPSSAQSVMQTKKGRRCWCFSPTRSEPSPSYASAKTKKPMRFV